jgi:hypothetical protein
LGLGSRYVGIPAPAETAVVFSTAIAAGGKSGTVSVKRIDRHPSKTVVIAANGFFVSPFIVTFLLAEVIRLQAIHPPIIPNNTMMASRKVASNEVIVLSRALELLHVCFSHL